MFESIFQRPDQASQKSAITAVEELIQPDNISMKTRLIDPNSVTALEFYMFHMAHMVPSPKQLLLAEALRKEGWTVNEAGVWSAKAGTEAEKAVTLANAASDIGGRHLQIQYLELLKKQLGLMNKDAHIDENYRVTPSDYMFFWNNIKKINNVSWNGKGRIEFLQGIIGSMFLQSEQTAQALQKITQG